MKNTEISHNYGGAGAPLNLSEFLEVLQRRWLIVILAGTIGAVAGFGLAWVRPAVYEATASGVLIPAGNASVSEEYAGENLAKSRALTYESIATSRPVAESVVTELGLGEEPSKLLTRISTSVPVETSEIRVTAEGLTPVAAQELADAWIRALGSQVDSMNSAGATAGDTGTASSALRLIPVGSAYLPEKPTTPQFPLFIGGGMLMGLLVGLFLAVSGSGPAGRLHESGPAKGKYAHLGEPRSATSASGWSSDG